MILANGYRTLASGTLAFFSEGRLVSTDADYDGQEYEGPHCSICDALGHGYPGGGPCPLEMTDYSGEPAWAM